MGLRVGPRRHQWDFVTRLGNCIIMSDCDLDMVIWSVNR